MSEKVTADGKNRRVRGKIRRRYDKIHFKMKPLKRTYGKTYQSILNKSCSTSQTLQLTGMKNIENSRSYSLDKQDNITGFGGEISSIKNSGDLRGKAKIGKFPSLTKIALNSFSTQDPEKSSYTPLMLRDKRCFLNSSQTPKPTRESSVEYESSLPRSTRNRSRTNGNYLFRIFKEILCLTSLIRSD